MLRGRARSLPWHPDGPADRSEEKEGRGVHADHPRGPDQGRHDPGNRRADDERGLREAGEERVAVHLIFLGQRLSDQRVPPGVAPGVQQRGSGEQRHIDNRSQHPGDAEHRNHAESDCAQRGVDRDQPHSGQPAQWPAQHRRAERGRQCVGGDGEAGPHASLLWRREREREPGHRDHGYAVAERGDQHGRQDPAQHRLAQHPAEWHSSGDWHLPYWPPRNRREVLDRIALIRPSQGALFGFPRPALCQRNYPRRAHVLVLTVDTKTAYCRCRYPGRPMPHDVMTFA